MHDMSASTAMSTYSILSIGDGLISQIPALLISIAAGIIVTRVPGELRQNLANDLSEQISRQPQALSLAAGVLLVFALIPGFPAIYFVGLAAAVYGGAWWIKRRQPHANGTLPDGSPGLSGEEAQATMTPGAIPLMVRMASDIGRSKALDDAFRQLRQQKFEYLGIPLPTIHLQLDASLEPSTLRVLLYQEPVLTLTVPDGLLLADAHTMPLAQTLHNDRLPFGGHTLQWLDPEHHETLTALGVVLHRDQARITHCLSLVVDRYAAEFIGVQETRFLMDSMESSHAELVKEVQRQMPVGRIADVLQRLVGEGISIRDLRSILEALTEWSPREKDPIMLTEYARVALRRHITTRYRGNEQWISGWMIGDRIEEMIRESIRQTAAGSYSTLEATQNQAIIQGIRQHVGDGDPRRAVLITAIDVRRFVRKIVEREYAGLHVLSFQELGDEVELRVIGNIDLIGQT